MLTVNNLSRSASLGDRIKIADSFITRLVGLLGCRRLQPGEGLLLTRTRAVHTWGMRFAIDCLFLDEQCRVVHAVPALVPWRFSPVVKKACQVLELPAGTITESNTLSGDVIRISAIKYL